MSYNSKPFKILSLDGGGSWSLIQAMTLQELYKDRKGNNGEEIRGHEILKDYDLVIANSGGSIVLGGLIANKKLQEIIDSYREEAIEKIFSRLTFKESPFPTNFLIFFHCPFGPKYSSARKLNGLKKQLGNCADYHMTEIPSKIGKSDLKFLICAFDAQKNKASFFRSDLESKARSAKLLSLSEEVSSKDVLSKLPKLVDAIHASSNAPVNYFDFPANVPLVRGSANITEAQQLSYMWDGALGGFNNPVAAGLVEAIVNGVDPNEIRILSIGTADKISSLEERVRLKKMFDSLPGSPHRIRRGLEFFFYTITNMAKSIIYEPPDWSNYIAFVMRYGSSIQDNRKPREFIRLSPMIHHDKGRAKDQKELVSKLAKLDMDVTKQNDIELIKACFHAWIAGELYNQPIQSYFAPSEDAVLQTAIGHETFAEGKAEWERWIK